MTTDLTGDFGLSEEEFDWDVFVPDPDDTEIAAEAAALDDEDELALDDSEFDWDAALREDPETEAGEDAGARAGAAYDRIVDTVRRSVEEPEPEADGDPEPVAVQARKTQTETEREPEAEPELVETPTWALEPDAAEEAETVPEWGPEAFVPTDGNAEPEAAFEPEPEWEPVEARITEMAAMVASVGPVESFPIPPPEAETAVSEEAALWENDGETTSSMSAAPAPTRRSRTHQKHEQNRRSRVFTATVVLACLVLMLVAAAAVLHARHHPTTATTTAGEAPAHAAPSASSSSEAARIQTATDALDSATTSATVGLSSLATFPTPSNVEKVINPYVSSLQLYGTLLAGSAVPAPTRSAASSAEAQVRQDLQFLATIDALPPLQLGSFLKQFDADATQLQTTLSALEQNLRAATS